MKPLKLLKLTPAVLALGLLLGVQPAYAHGIGDRYDLPLPLGFFAVGGAAAVALSFVIVGIVVRGESRVVGYPRFNLFRYRWVEFLLSGPFLWPIKLFSVFLLWLVLTSALFGTLRPVDNFAPTFIWVIWWVGMGFFTALFGNIWALVNPWKVIFSWAEGLLRIVRPEGSLSLGFDYPQKWGIWPAVVLFFAFAWVENAFAESSGPRHLGWMVAVYTLITWGGMLAFGKHQWLRHGEVFSVVFGLVSKFSITEVRVTDPQCCEECSEPGCRSDEWQCVDCYECFEYAEEREFNLRPPAVGLSNVGSLTPSVVAMVMLLLATVTFDGFSATPEWLYVQTFFITQFPELKSPFLNGVTIANTLGLIAFPLIFTGFYWAFCYWMFRVVGRRPPLVVGLVGAYAFSLIPIALAYNYAHFLSFLLITGQEIIRLSSDPFGIGWDLFRTADYVVNIRVSNARFIWIFSVVAIVVGHIFAVYLAHIRAMRLYTGQGLVLKSQLPMLGLMVVYTVVSLWIVSRPITE